MPTLLASFTAGLNDPPATMATTITTWLTDNPTFFFRSMSVFRRESSRHNEQAIVRLLGDTGTSGPGYSCAVVQGSTTSFNDAMSAFWAANPSAVIMAQEDFTTIGARDAGGVVMLILYTTNQLRRGEAYSARPTGAISAGSTGTATLYDADGTNVGTATIKNAGASTWPLGQSNPVVWTGGGWVGVNPA